MIEVRLPDGSIGQFPDGMSDADIEAVLQQQFGSPQPAPVAAQAPIGPNPLERFGQATGSTLTGMAQGATMGAYDEVAAALGSPIKGIENLMTGQDQINGFGDVLPFLGRSFLDAREGQQALVNQAYEQAPVAAMGGDIAGALGFGLLSGGSNAATLARPTMMGMAGRGAVEGGLNGAASGFNAAEESTLPARVRAAMQGGVAGALLGTVTGGVVGSNASRAQTAAVETVDELKSAARELYEAGKRNSDIFATPEQSSDVARRVKGIAESANVILPDGRFNKTYSALEGPIDTLEAYAGRNVSVGQIQRIRDNIRDAAANPEPGVQPIAMDMLDEFNDYAYTIYPDLAVADDLWWKAKTGEMVEKLGELATARSGQYTQSGMENALRAEFRLLERQIIKGRVKGLSPELIEQISSISRGDSMQNAARWASKFSLKNPVTMMGGTAAGFATGSLPVAAAVWGTAQGAGALAEKMAKDKFAVASALARNGGPLAPVPYDPIAQALVQGSGNLGGRFAANFGS